MERKVRYLCPVCFLDSGIKVINYPKAEFDMSKDIEIEEGFGEYIEPSVDVYLDFRGICKNCNYPVTFLDIDEGIVDIIQYLNFIGYNTIYSCEGHIKDSGNYDYPYLIFDCEWDDRVYFEMIKNLPESWEIFKTDLSTPNNYSFNNEFRLYCRNPIKYENYLQDLKDYIYNCFPKLIFNPKIKYKDNYNKYGLTEEELNGK